MLQAQELLLLLHLGFLDLPPLPCPLLHHAHAHAADDTVLEEVPPPSLATGCEQVVHGWVALALASFLLLQLPL